MQGMHMSAMEINIHLICACHMQEWRSRNDVETLLLFLDKIIFPPYKTPKYPCTEQTAY